MIYVVHYTVGGRLVVSAVFLMLWDAEAFVKTDTSATSPYTITEVDSWEHLYKIKLNLKKTLGENK